MLSKKLTFSLITSFAVLLVFGLACFAPPAMADGPHNFGVTITAAETMIDVSSDPGMQIASGRDRASRDLTNDNTRKATLITLLITTNEIVNLGDPDAGVSKPDLTGRSGEPVHPTNIKEEDKVLDTSDLVIDAYDAEGRSLGILPLRESDGVVILSHRDPDNPGREFLAQIDEDKLTSAYTAIRGGGQTLEIHTLLFSIPPGKMEQADIAHVTAVRNADHHGFHTNGRVKVYRVDLVDDDQGNPKYNSGVSAAMIATNGDSDTSGSGTPGVVAIQSLREDRGLIYTGPFTVRVILTEEPTGGLTKELIDVRNGEATQVTKGTTLKGGSSTPKRDSELTTDIVDYYTMANMVVEDQADLPEATGRDNKFHQYFVTINPAPGLTGADVVISVKQFSDKVIPAPNVYVPLSYQQIVATTLTENQEIVRDARVMNETLTVTATTIASVDIFKASADARLPHEKFIPEKQVIPANGYLVLISGSYSQAGILGAAAKLADKKRTGEQDYNTVDNFAPPHPGADLANHFRNGGAIQLAYQDIPGNTAEADAATGYAGASSAVINAGDVIINEIMWGYDRGIDDRAYTKGQWIELHNTTSAPISLDKQEWILSYGSTTSFTAGIVVDKVDNDPASGYWSVPGQSGVSKPDPVVKTGVTVKGQGTTQDIQILDRVVKDVISMSRIDGGPDGGAVLSWAASILPSANFSASGRIGTPGAKNRYDTSAVDAAAAAAEVTIIETTVPVATAEDILISEIMVNSNDGKLPQWIELANVSEAEVSLAGWSVDIDNDADASSTSYRLDIGNVTVDKDQVVLIVSKTGRNSGVGNGAGMLRGDRIVDVQSQVSPGEGTYRLISETGFKISLVIPPSTGSVKTGDVVGNLGMGWELPMSEGGSRSSLIRREMGETGTEIMGTDAAGWVLASDTMLDGAYRTTYYGDSGDSGTPGYDAGGALPVELSIFGAKRDPLTGQVIITWETQSELNNAGFYIKRSQQKNGTFVAVNPTMIAGAGTTSEKRSYTYTDTTAQPNIVYYYQIEDVSLDGNRQTLTRAHRLKGHIGAAGKATTTWGELKTSLDQ